MHEESTKPLENPIEATSCGLRFKGLASVAFFDKCWIVSCSRRADGGGEESGVRLVGLPSVRAILVSGLVVYRVH